MYGLPYKITYTNSTGGAYNSVILGLIYNTGYAPLFECTEQTAHLMGVPGFSQDMFILDQFHFHFGRTCGEGSEHALDMMYYPVELHLVHYNSKFESFDEALGSPFGVAVVAIFLQIEIFTRTHLDDFMPNISKVLDPRDIPRDSEIRVSDLLPENLDFYTYVGSLTAPPCTSNIRWIVLKTPIDISWENTGEIADLVKGWIYNTAMASTQEDIVTMDELNDFVVRCMESVGTKNEHAHALAELIVSADYRGHYSHGLNRLDMYINEVKEGMTNPGTNEPFVVKETVATALVDGNNVLGPVVGKYCIDLAVKKAKEAGIAFVTARGSNHFGIAGWYSIRAMKEGMLGMAFTNTSPMMVPTRGKERTLGTNPLTLAAAAKNGDEFVLDMATTSVALGKLEMQDRKGEALPSGWAVDKDGKETKDAKNFHGLLPLGGVEQSSGYKGYGLAMMVEIFCGILSGGSFGPNVRSWKDFDRQANLGQCFIAINPEAFEDGFSDRLQDLMDHCRKLEPVDGASEVLIPGDPERKHMELCDKLGGIPYHPNQITYANGIAKQCGLSQMKIKS